MLACAAAASEGQGTSLTSPYPLAFLVDAPCSTHSLIAPLELLVSRCYCLLSRVQSVRLFSPRTFRAALSKQWMQTQMISVVAKLAKPNGELHQPESSNQMTPTNK
jgi:hypothetical protein